MLTRVPSTSFVTMGEIVTQHNGKVVALTANFRAWPELVNWCNSAFQSVFPSTANKYQPAACPMLVGRSGQDDGQLGKRG
jgi:hypothetical protein